MRWFAALPLKRKLTVVILSTCALVLLLACAALAVYETIDFRRALRRDATVLADMFGRNAQAALAFDDDQAVAGLLAALQAESDIAAARVYDAAGAPFADYQREGHPSALPVRPAEDGHRFEGGYLALFRPIILDGKRIGTIHLHVDLAGMNERLLIFGAMAGLVLVTSLLVALGLSARLQRPITRPILRLAETARLVAELRDYSVRAPPAGEDEIAALTDAFNHMLDRIQEQNQALAAKAEELERSNRELEQFAYIAAHDLQEPVRMISSYLQVLERRIAPLLDDRTRQHFAYASNGAIRIGEMIRSLLEYSRIGREGGLREPFEAASALRAALDNLRLEIADADADIDADPLPTIAADRGQIIRLFQNLISNALKFRSDDPPRIRITSRPVDGADEFAVSDNGIGIPPEDGAKLFNLFQRLHPTGAYPGTGIGLASCKKIVERHGGRIWFEENRPRGTVFRFTIPRGSHA